MPDITPPNTFVTGTSLDAEPVAENTYEPNSTPNNMEVINGRLTETNLVAPATVTRDMVRRGAFFTGKTDGATSNLDYFEDLFEGDWDPDVLNSIDDIAIGVPGASQTYYVPYDCAGVYFSWHIGTICQAKTPTLGLNNEGKVRAMLFIDGVPIDPVSRQLKKSTRTLVPRAGATATIDSYNSFGWAPDHRWWSGHFVIHKDSATSFFTAGVPRPYTKGWHTVEIRVAHPHQHLRIKTRRMTAIPFR